MTAQFLTLRQAHDYAGLSISFWRRQIASGQVPSYKISNRILLKKVEVEKFIESSKVEVPNVKEE